MSGSGGFPRCRRRLISREGVPNAGAVAGHAGSKGLNRHSRLRNATTDPDPARLGRGAGKRTA